MDMWNAASTSCSYSDLHSLIIRHCIPHAMMSQCHSDGTSQRHSIVRLGCVMSWRSGVLTWGFGVLTCAVCSVVRPQTGDGRNDTAIELTMGARAGNSTARRVDGELSGLPIRRYCTGSRMLNLLSRLADILMFSKYRRI